MDDTIVAISSALSPGLRGIIRLSGPQTFSIIAQAVTAPLPATRYGRVTGEVTIGRWRTTIPATFYLMQGPNSYTGEDMAELHTFSSLPCLHELIEQFMAAGARPAQPGEFTRRAFLAGRMDLTQVEAVEALISAASDAQRRQAMLGVSGELSRRLQAACSLITETLALTEAHIDFMDEEIGVPPVADMARRIGTAAQLLKQLLQYAPVVGQGRITVCLFGLPNVGKSSLLNTLTGRPVAITSAMPGTTRDYLESELTLGDASFTVVDTPGIMPMPQGVQARAQQQAKSLVQGADLILFLVDGSEPLSDFALGLVGELPAVPLLWVKTKQDLPPAWSNACLAQYRSDAAVLSVSIYQPETVERLKSWLTEQARARDTSSEPELLNLRQRYIAGQALEALQCAADGLHGGLSYEFVALDLRSSLNCLGELLGRVTTEDILEQIFSRFCIGK